MSQAAPRRALFLAPLQVLAAAGIVLYLVTAVPPALSRGVAFLSEAWKFRGESGRAALVRTRGAAYWAGVEKIRDAIPRDGAYLLAAEKGSGGMDVFVRFDLAPRRALWAGEVGGGHLGPAPGAPPWVVIARAPDRAPRLVSSGVFFHDAAVELAPGRLDDAIPCNVDDPPDGATIREPLTVRGWCQELGGRPCSALRFVLDGEERTPDELERYPRADVEAVVKGIGRCDGAGFRAKVGLGNDAGGEHALTVFFLTADGRYRRMGPNRFVVENVGRP